MQQKAKDGVARSQRESQIQALHWKSPVPCAPLWRGCLSQLSQGRNYLICFRILRTGGNFNLMTGHAVFHPKSGNYTAVWSFESLSACIHSAAVTHLRPSRPKLSVAFTSDVI